MIGDARLERFRLVALVAGCVLSAVGVPIREGASAQQATFRTRTDLVSVNVSVKQGRLPVANLTARDFALTDNGVEQTVDAISLERVPIDLTLVITSYESAGRDEINRYITDVRSGSTVRRSLLPQDRLRLVWVHGAIRGALVITEESLLARENDIEHILSVSVIDGLFYALAWPVEPHRRHLVVAYTEGADRYSVLERETLPRLAAHSDAVLHVVFRGETNGSQGIRQDLWDAQRKIVSETAQRTGGMVHKTMDAPQDLAAIIEDYRTSYVLQYTPRGVPAPGWHELRVRVTRPGKFDVRARQGYEVDRLNKK